MKWSSKSLWGMASSSKRCINFVPFLHGLVEYGARAHPIALSAAASEEHQYMAFPFWLTAHFHLAPQTSFKLARQFGEALNQRLVFKAYAGIFGLLTKEYNVNRWFVPSFQ